jgi:hypothetical protein
MQELLHLMFYILYKHGPYLCIVNRSSFLPQETPTLFFQKNYRLLLSEDIIFFSDIRHKIKHSIFRKEFKSIYPK